MSIFARLTVAESSLAYDLGEKADLYAASGVTEYWVVDCPKRRVIAHRDPGKSGFHSVRTYDAGEVLSPMSRPQVILLPSVLFQPATR
jgi:Uma2 family endonuclease